MRLLKILTLGVSPLLLAAPAAIGATITDGDFSNWNFTYVTQGGSAATASRIATGGNPNAYLDTDMTGTFNNPTYIFAIKNDYSTTADIHGTAWAFLEDYQAESFNPAATYDDMALAVQQGSSLFYHVPTKVAYQGDTSWQTTAIAGNPPAGLFNASDFLRVTGSDTLNFNGGVPTYFGTVLYNNSFYTDLNMGLDNWSLSSPSLVAIPEPGTGLLITGLLACAAQRRRRRA